MRGKERREALDKLRAIELFSDCSDDELEAIDGLLTELRFSEGQRITREGGGALEFIVIVDGMVSVIKGDEVVATVRAGSFVGELGLLDEQTRNATVRATTTVRAFVLDAGEFERLLEISPSVRERIESTASVRRD